MQQKWSVDRKQNDVWHYMNTFKIQFIYGGNDFRPGWGCRKHRQAKSEPYRGTEKNRQKSEATYVREIAGKALCVVP